MIPYYKNVLIIAYNFPPMGGGGVIRMQKFCKYLPTYNWQPIVLTSSVSGLISDNSLLKELPDSVKIYRTKPSRITEWKFRLLRSIINQSSGSAKTSGPPNTKNHLLYRIINILARIKKYTEGIFLIPDQNRPWIGQATKEAAKIIKENRIDAMITTGPPHSVHLIGLLLSKKYQIPWLIDFRDDWYTNPLFTPPTWFGKKIVARMEHEVVNKADVLTTVTPPSRERFTQRYPLLPKEKFVTLWNGYDPDDFQPIHQPVVIKEILSLTYVGSFGGSRTSGKFLEAITMLKENNFGLFNLLHVSFIGQFNDSRELWSRVFNERVTFHPHLPHAYSLLAMRQADALLLFLNSHEDGATAMPGKVFEYCAARRPIVACTCPGLLNDFVNQYHFGWTADIDDKMEIYLMLKNLLTAWTKNKTLNFNPDINAINKFNRKITTGKLADLLNSIIDKQSFSVNND